MQAFMGTLRERTTNYELQIANCKLRIANCEFPHSPLPILMTNRSLPPEVEFSERVTFKDYVKTSESQQSNKPLPLWRFIVPLLIQTGLILAVPSQAVYTNITGRNVVLQTTSVNPYDLRQGNSMRMRYDISSIETLRRLPGWSEVVRRNSANDGDNNDNRNGNRNRNRNRDTNRNNSLEQGTSLYVIMQEQRFARLGVPRAWRPVRVNDYLPNSLAANQVALRGTYQNGAVNYGLETYYVSEDQRQEMNNDISRSLSRRSNQRNRQQQPMVVEVRVDPQGQAVPLSMWVQNRNYRF
jgi:uncharacterized membrane-anchored protein